MEYTDSQTFNPEILYAFDPWKDSQLPPRAHSHDHLEISIVLEGEADYVIENQPARVGAGCVMVFNPGVVHSETQPEGVCSHQLHIGISNILLTGLTRNHFPNKHALLSLGEYHSKVLDKAWRVVQEFNNSELEFPLMVKALIIEMLVLIIRGLSKEQGGLLEQNLTQVEKRKQNLVNQTIYYLENHFTQEITLEILADTFYISPTHLSKVFKEITGLSPINYLIQIRLKRANDLLKNDKMTVKEVAESVGYHDAFHFSRLFKKHYGITPTQAANAEDKSIKK